MQVIVYGKKNCGICDAAKDKLKRMGFSYEVRDVEYYTTLHEGWRTDGSVDVLASSTFMEGAIPIIDIEGDLVDYPTAMRLLKRLRREKVEERQVEAVPA